MGRIFQKAPRKGEPISRRGLAAGLAAIDYALTHMRVENGRVVWSALGAPTIMFGDDGAGASPAMLETVAASSWPYGTRFAFGITVAGAAVTVYPGALEMGDTVYTADQETITITADGQYIGLEVDRDTGTATITGPHASRPVSTGAIYKTALYVFDLTDGVAELSRECINDIRLEATL